MCLTALTVLKLAGPRDSKGTCRRFCSCQSLKELQDSAAFNKQPATGSISTSYEQLISASFNKVLNVVRDQGVGGSNPLSPTNVFNKLQAFFPCQNFAVGKNATLFSSWIFA